MQVVHYAAGDWGVGELWLDDDGHPVWHELPTTARAARRDSPLGAVPLATPKETTASREIRASTGLRDSPLGAVPLACRFEAYFAGERVSFDDVEIDLEWCTPLQRAIAEALRGVPYGETVSYGELAALAGRPQAPRAGGAFCSQNRLPLILPCHRVVAAGGIGGYGSLGVEYKRRMLELEGAAL
jgi:methylated-DNA-[protein]-cysteine S-methyltransferase